MENTANQLWMQTSRAEWITPCDACHHFNIPTLDQDLEGMLGPKDVRREISEDAPGVVCAKCGSPIFPRKGWWEHGKPELRDTWAGYHFPQILFPMHYADPVAWSVIQAKRKAGRQTGWAPRAYSTPRMPATASNIRAGRNSTS